MAALLLAAGSSARADVTPAGGERSLGTVVNQNCGDGLCGLSITGGRSAGNNLFHRFQNFDTRSNGGLEKINTIQFSNGSGIGNVIVGVLSPTYIGVPISLQNAANLFWLSPAGLTIGNGGGFSNVLNLTLSTATGLKFGTNDDQLFDAVQTSAEEADQLNGIPQFGPQGLVTITDSLNQLEPVGLVSNGNLVLDGGLLTVDQSLLMDAQAGDVRLRGSVITGGGPVESGTTPNGDVELTGAGIRLEPKEGSSAINLENGTGSITLTGNTRGVLIDNGSLTTSEGAITINGTSVSSNGLQIIDSSISSTSGDISLSGKGGTADGGSADGLELLNSELFSESGSISLSGYGGSEANSIGMKIYGSSVITQTGPITAFGSGGASSVVSTGLLIGSTIQSASLLSSESGDISLSGYGGTVASLDDPASSTGLQLFSSTINNSSGNIDLIGVAGSANGTRELANGTRALARGITVNTARISNQSGNISLTGTGGEATSSGEGFDANALGIRIGLTTIIENASGSITLVGTGGVTNGSVGYSEGIEILEAVDFSTSAGGSISFLGTGGTATATTSASAIGIDLSFDNNTIGVNASSETQNGSIVLQGFGGQATATDGRADAGGTKVTYSFLKNTSGAIELIGKGGTADGSIALANGIDSFIDVDFSISAGGSMSFLGTGGTATATTFASANGIDLNTIGVNADSETQNGSIVLQGFGGQATATDRRADAHGIEVSDSFLKNTSGAIELIGKGGTADASFADATGIDISTPFASDPTDISTQSGPISLLGIGGTATGSSTAGATGIDLDDNTISVNADSGSAIGSITLQGFGGQATATDIGGEAPAYGIEISNSILANTSGSIELAGEGGTTSGSGNISLAGTGGSGAALALGSTGSFGVEIRSGSTLASSGGAISITGNGGTGGGVAVRSQAGTLIQSASVGPEESGGESPLASTSEGESPFAITISSSGGPVVLAGEVFADGPVSFPSVSQLNLDSALFSGSGLVTLPTAGTTTVTGEVNVQALEIAGGTVEVASGATLRNLAGFTNSGTISGNGSVDVGSSTLTNEGTIRPGSDGSAGILTIQGNLALTGDSTLAVDLLVGGGGNDSFGGGLQSDQLVVTGSAELDGNLIVTLGSTPAEGQSFDIISAASMTGGFNPITPTDLNGGIVAEGTLYRLTQSGSGGGRSSGPISISGAGAPDVSSIGLQIIDSSISSPTPPTPPTPTPPTPTPPTPTPPTPTPPTPPNPNPNNRGSQQPPPDDGDPRAA